MFQARAGEELILSDQVGSLEYKGPGMFIASGKGILPILNILKHLKRADAISGHTLLYVARTQEEVLYERILRHILGTNCVFVIGSDSSYRLEPKKIDETLIRQKSPTLQQEFYIAGPAPFVQHSSEVLAQLNVVTPYIEIVD